MTRPQTEAVVVATAGMILPAIILILCRDASLILSPGETKKKKNRKKIEETNVQISANGSTTQRSPSLQNHRLLSPLPWNSNNYNNSAPVVPGTHVASGRDEVDMKVQVLVFLEVRRLEPQIRDIHRWQL